MKPYFLILLFLTASFLPISAFALGWHLQYQDPSQRTLYAVKFVDSLNGWVVGDSGVILHTANGGNDWNHQTGGTLHALRGVSFTDENHGCAVGDSGTILHTNNGGDWNTRASNTTRNLRSVSFVDSLHGWAIGDSGTILYTGNGGSAWSTQTSGTEYALNSVCFIDQNNGWAVGGNYMDSDTLTLCSVILHTSNSGTTWNIQDAGMNQPLYGVSFTDVNHGCTVGGYYANTFPYFHMANLRTNNGGATWTSAFFWTYPLNCVVFIDTVEGWAVGWGGRILHINPVWPNWGPDFTTYNHTLYGISVIDTLHGWAVGELGGILSYSGFDKVTENPKTLLPEQLVLYSYPNPFNATTTISYNVSKPELIELKLFDLTGREIEVLVKQKENPGTHNISFDGKNLPTGTYFLRLQAGTAVETRKIVLLK